ncbi:unnamed protein product [Adineta steineri]|uniref:Fibronectin type-III domain-containing protein n=1 Tax=Adineta steineri TaxID=433720 RepID=A0A815GUL7_9BILA|nr:unnamed protein product [Adineta steineri]
MENDDDNHEFYFNHKNYFLRFKSNNEDDHISKSIRHALEYFVDDLKYDRNKTIDYFFNQPTMNNIFLFITQLLLSDDNCICVNSAYIIGSIIEIENGLELFLSIFTVNCTIDVIQRLCQLLTHSDFDCVLNATGILGTICSSKEGRDFILNHTSINDIVSNIAMLLNSINVWIAGNAALVLARITIEGIGCHLILTHNKHHEILNQLLTALDINDANRSTNLAFTIARLIEEEDGKKILINNCEQNHFFEILLKMLEINPDKSINKNACYALSCLCTSQYGYQLCIQSKILFYQILVAIEKILLSYDHETVWFALMSLTSIAKYDGANEYLCYSKNLLKIIKLIQDKWIDFKDIQDESKLLWFMLHKHIKPNQPRIDSIRNISVHISWDSYMNSCNEQDIQYCILLDDVPIKITRKTNYLLNDLKSNTLYNVKIQYRTTQGESMPSDATVFQTDDELVIPSIINLHVVRTAMTAVRIAWESLDINTCHSFKGYQTYIDDIEYEFTTQCGITIGSLAIDTMYSISVCVVTMKGKGPCSSINVKTDSAGDCLPAPPTFPVIGRRELHIKWQAPEVISGRFSRYELICNGRCIYSGTEQEYHATMLKSNTEYTIAVVLITNDGRFRSRTVKTRTLKDEFHNSPRHSLYEPPTQSQLKLKRIDTFHVRKTSSNQNVQIPTARFPKDSSYKQTLPVIFQNSKSRPSRNVHRSKTELYSQQITVPIIIPTLDINSSLHTNHLTQSKSVERLLPRLQRIS